MRAPRLALEARWRREQAISTVGLEREEDLA